MGKDNHNTNLLKAKVLQGPENINLIDNAGVSDYREHQQTTIPCINPILNII